MAPPPVAGTLAAAQVQRDAVLGWVLEWGAARDTDNDALVRALVEAGSASTRAPSAVAQRRVMLRMAVDVFEQGQWRSFAQALVVLADAVPARARGRVLFRLQADLKAQAVMMALRDRASRATIKRLLWDLFQGEHDEQDLAPGSPAHRDAVQHNSLLLLIEATQWGADVQRIQRYAREHPYGQVLARLKRLLRPLLAKRTFLEVIARDVATGKYDPDPQGRAAKTRHRQAARDL